MSDKEFKIEDGVPFIIPHDRVLDIRCCRCDLHHFWSFKVLSDGSIEATVTSTVPMVKQCCDNCRLLDDLGANGPFCSNCWGVDGTTEISSDFYCQNWESR